MSELLTSELKDCLENGAGTCRNADMIDELRAEIARLKARVEELEEENDHLQDCWFRDETICPDGSLRPKVSDLLNRIAKLEAYVAELEAEKRGEK